MRKRRVGLGLVITAAVLLGGCDNPIDFLAELEIEVKQANDKFLQITVVAPDRNDFDVSPGQPVVVEFDRSVDVRTINTKTVRLTSGGVDVPYDWNYLAATRTLVLEPKPFLESDVGYTVTLSDLLAEDGGDLQEAYSWSFKTKPFPAGTVVLAGGLTHVNTNVAIPFSVQTNDFAAFYRYANSAVDVISASNLAVVGKAGAGTVSFPPVEGEKTIYVQFLNGTGVEITEAETDTVVLDQTGPTVNIGPNRTVRATTTVPVAVKPLTVMDPLAGGAAGSGIDDSSYAWSGTGITFGDATSASTSFQATNGAPHEATYNITLQVQDNLGNLGSDTLKVTWDTAPPSAPEFDWTQTSPSAIGVADIQWTWSSTDGDGTGQYIVNLNGDKSETDETVSGVKKPKAGEYLLKVFELDDVGNEGLVATHLVTVADVVPADVLVDTRPVQPFDWPDYTLGKSITYNLWIYNPAAKDFERVASGLTSSSWPGLAGALERRENYQWFYQAADFGVVVYQSKTFEFGTL